jgi:hypothetical protein
VGIVERESFCGGGILTDTVTVALVSTGGTFLTAVVALILSSRTFASIEARILALENRVDRDIKDLIGAVNDLDKRLTKVEIKLGIQP